MLNRYKTYLVYEMQEITKSFQIGKTILIK